MDNFIKAGIAIGGAAASFLFGGWSAFLSVPLAFVIFDFVTGMIAAGMEGKLKSKVGVIGIARKVFIFCMVAIAHLIDTALGDQNFIRDATIFFYLANELLSISENAGRIGLPVPELKRAVEVLKGKGEAQRWLHKSLSQRLLLLPWPIGGRATYE